MYTLDNFQFHKFNINTQRNFFHSNDYNNRIKSRTHSKRFFNNNNNYINQNNNRYLNNIPTNFSQQIYRKNNINILNKLSEDKFPKKKLLNTDFESLLKNGESNKIDELLPSLIYNDLSFSKNNHLRLVLSKFQILLKFLFSQQQNLLNNNNKIEEMFNNKKSNMNNKIKENENEEYKIEKLFKSNNKQIEQISQKIKTYKNILTNYGKGNLIPKSYSSNKINNKNRLYQCNICIGKTFNSYEEMQEHYIKEHTNNNMTNKNNNNITKSYLDTKLNLLKNEVKNYLLNINEQNKNEKNNFNNNNNEKLKGKMDNNINMSNFNILTNDEGNINTYLNRLEYEQKEQYEQLNTKIDQMKNEVFSEIKKLKYSPPIVKKEVINQIEPKKIEDQKEYEESKKKVDENKKEDFAKININSQINDINDNTNETINLIYNQKVYTNKDIINSQKNELNKKSSFKEASDINSNVNPDKINNDKPEQLINPFPIINDETKELKYQIVNNSINPQENENEKKNTSDNIANENNINVEANKNESKNIIHSTGKYIDKSKIIQEESKLRESTLHNQTPNDNINNQNNITDNKDKYFTNTGESLMKSQNKKDINILNNISKFSVLQNQLEEKEFINKIKERDENILLKKDKLSEIEEEYEAVKLKNMYLLEKKEENLIKEQQNKYFKEDSQNLGKQDYEAIIKNIINDNKKNLENNKIYKQFFNNLIQKNELLDILPKEMKISRIDLSQNDHIKNHNNIGEINNFKMSEISINKSFGELKNLRKKNDDDFL